MATKRPSKYRRSSRRNHCDDCGENLEATAVKVEHPIPLAIGPIWREIEQAGTIEQTNGHEPLASASLPAEPAAVAGKG